MKERTSSENINRGHMCELYFLSDGEEEQNKQTNNTCVTYKCNFNSSRNEEELNEFLTRLSHTLRLGSATRDSIRILPCSNGSLLRLDFLDPSLLQICKPLWQSLLAMPTVRILLNTTYDIDCLEDVNHIVDTSTLHAQVFANLTNFDNRSIIITIGRGILEQVHKVGTEYAQGLFLP